MITRGIIKPSNENVAVKTAEAVTDNILPIIISSEEILVEIKVSIVPLSFSPAPKSIAGYIEPVITYITKKKARIPPKIDPAASFSVVRSSSNISIGLINSSSKSKLESRSDLSSFSKLSIISSARLLACEKVSIFFEYIVIFELTFLFRFSSKPSSTAMPISESPSLTESTISCIAPYLVIFSLSDSSNLFSS